MFALCFMLYLSASTFLYSHTFAPFSKRGAPSLTRVCDVIRCALHDDVIHSLIDRGKGTGSEAGGTSKVCLLVVVVVIQFDNPELM